MSQCINCGKCKNPQDASCITISSYIASCLELEGDVTLDRFVQAVSTIVCQLQTQTTSNSCIQIIEEYINIGGATSLPLTYVPGTTSYAILFYRNGLLQLIDEGGWDYDSGTNSITVDPAFENIETAQVVYFACDQEVTDNTIHNDLD